MDSKIQWKRVWVEREESWECKIAPPSGNRIILWADGSSLCVGWHFPVTPSRVMLCDVCDWLLPRPCEAMGPGAMCFWPAASWELFILALSASFCLFVSFCLLLPRLSCSACFWPSGVYFQLEENALVFSCETKPLTGDSWRVTPDHAFSLCTQTVSIPTPFMGHKGKILPKLSVVSVTQRYMLLCVMIRNRQKNNCWKSKCAVCCACVWGRGREKGKQI